MTQLLTREQVLAILDDERDLYHYYTYSEQLIFESYDPQPNERYIAVFPIDQPVDGTFPVSF